MPLSHACQSEFIYHAWEDGGIVFDRRSGYTHLLDPDTMQVFEVIAKVLQERGNVTKLELSMLTARELPGFTSNDIDQAIDRLSQLSILEN